MNKEAAIIAGKLNLSVHPEGGFFRETYRSVEIAPKEALPERFPADRNFSTGIYFLLEGKQVSKLHRIKSDEMWHHYLGSSLLIHIIDELGNYRAISLGSDLLNNDVPQAVVPAGCWFGASLEDESSFALTGCTVSPGFDFTDFEMGKKETLLKKYPEHESIIQKLT